MQEVIFKLRRRRCDLNPPRSRDDVAVIGTLYALNIVAVKLLPHRKLFRIGWQRATFRGFKGPVAATAPGVAAGVAGRPELVPGAASPRRDVVRGKQTVDENFPLAFLQAETSCIVEYFLAIARWCTGPFHPRHVYAVQQPGLAEGRIGADDAIENQKDIHARKVQKLPRKATQFVRGISASRIAESVMIRRGAAGFVC